MICVDCAPLFALFALTLAGTLAAPVPMASGVTNAGPGALEPGLLDLVQDPAAGLYLLMDALPPKGLEQLDNNAIAESPPGRPRRVANAGPGALEPGLFDLLQDPAAALSLLTQVDAPLHTGRSRRSLSTAEPADLEAATKQVLTVAGRAELMERADAWHLVNAFELANMLNPHQYYHRFYKAVFGAGPENFAQVSQLYAAGYRANMPTYLPTYKYRGGANAHFAAGDPMITSSNVVSPNPGQTTLNVGTFAANYQRKAAGTPGNLFDTVTAQEVDLISFCESETTSAEESMAVKYFYDALRRENEMMQPLVLRRKHETTHGVFLTTKARRAGWYLVNFSEKTFDMGPNAFQLKGWSTAWVVVKNSATQKEIGVKLTCGHTPPAVETTWSDRVIQETGESWMGAADVEFVHGDLQQRVGRMGLDSALGRSQGNRIQPIFDMIYPEVNVDNVAKGTATGIDARRLFDGKQRDGGLDYGTLKEKGSNQVDFGWLDRLLTKENGSAKATLVHDSIVSLSSGLKDGNHGVVPGDDQDHASVFQVTQVLL